jgi:hypothetical protein
MIALNWLRIKTSHQAFVIRVIKFWFEYEGKSLSSERLLEDCSIEII